MRGPATTPSSIACLSPNAGPPMSRTVVKPRISVSVASAPATRLLIADVAVDRLGGRRPHQHRVPVGVDQAGHQRAPAAVDAPWSPAVGCDRRRWRSARSGCPRTSTLTARRARPRCRRRCGRSRTASRRRAPARPRPPGLPPGESFGTCGPPFLPRDPRGNRRPMETRAPPHIVARAPRVRLRPTRPPAAPTAGSSAPAPASARPPRRPCPCARRSPRPGRARPGRRRSSSSRDATR